MIKPTRAYNSHQESAPPSCRRIAANVSMLRELWRRTYRIERTSGYFQRANLTRYNALS
jgi:hypothetical protein